MTTTRFVLDVPALADPHMRGPNMDTLLGAVGMQLDAMADQVMLSRLAGNPFAGGADAARTGAARLSDGLRIECEPIVLPVHARERGITLYATEPTLSRRIRLSRHRQLKKMRGTHWGEIEHVRPYFSMAASFPRITIVFQSNTATPVATWYSVAPDGTRTLKQVSPSNFNFDDRPALRTRWWAFLDFTDTGYSPPFFWDDGKHFYDDGSLWDTGDAVPLTAAAMNDIAAMLADWQSAHSWLAGVIGVWPSATGAPFPTDTGTPTQDASGWWSLPNGAGTWASVINPGTGLHTRPPNFFWLLDNPAP